MGDVMGARWRVRDTLAGLTLEVTLWNGCSLALTVPKDGEATVALRTGQREVDFATIGAASFKAWLDGAQGRR